MKITLQEIGRLLEDVSEKTGYPLEFSNFDSMAEEIKGVSGKYLYEKLYRRTERGKEEEVVTMHDNKLNCIAKFLGYKSIHQFLERGKVDPVLRALERSYYCYVRRNSEETVVFRSPARIYSDGSDYFFELRGPKWIYRGSVTLVKGCLFVVMKSDSGKALYHVYKIGVREKPHVLQGIFSGVSTSFEPIGGRVVLVAMDQEYEKMEGKELAVEELKKGPKTETRLAGYFDSYQENNLKIKPVVAFTEDDL